MLVDSIEAAVQTQALTREEVFFVVERVYGYILAGWAADQETPHAFIAHRCGATEAYTRDVLGNADAGNLPV